MNKPPVDSSSGQPGGKPIIAVSGVFYAVLVGVALLWLWLRDRMHLVSELAIGSHGFPIAMAVGSAAGLVVGGLLVWGMARFETLRAVGRHMATALGPLQDGAILWLAVASAVAEELFFRVALQDAVGTLWSAALFALLHTGPGITPIWTVIAFALGYGLSLLIEAGTGLLSITLARALISYLVLRRQLPP